MSLSCIYSPSFASNEIVVIVIARLEAGQSGRVPVYEHAERQTYRTRHGT